MSLAAFQAPIWQPSRRAKEVSTGVPLTSPVTLATSGPPYCCVQEMPLGGVAGFRMAALFFRAVQAAAALAQASQDLRATVSIFRF